MALNAARTIGAVAARAISGKELLVSPEAYAERMGICKACERFTHMPSKSTGNLWPRCLECGCWLDAKHKPLAKTWLSAAECPLKKWGAA